MKDHKGCKATAQSFVQRISFNSGRLSDMVADDCPKVKNVNPDDLRIIDEAAARIRQALAARIRAE